MHLASFKVHQVDSVFQSFRACEKGHYVTGYLNPIHTEYLKTDTLFLQTDTLSLQTDTLSLQTDTLFLQTDTLFLQTDTLSLQTDTLSLQTDTLSLQTDTLSNSDYLDEILHNLAFHQYMHGLQRLKQIFMKKNAS